MVMESEYFRSPLVGSKPYNMTPKEYKFCTEYLTNGFDQVKAAIAAKYKQPSAVASTLMKRQSITYFLEMHIREAGKNLNRDVTWMINKLVKLIDTGIPDDEDVKNIEMAKLALQGIAEFNKVQGHYAPTKTENLNGHINIEADLKTLQKVFPEDEREY